jgi:hypothetical protein
MGLPVRQRRVLGRIEGALRGSDPKLAALYAIFARLTRDEEMPRVEQLRHSALLALARIRLILGAIRARLHIRLLPRQRAVLFFPLAVALAVTSIVFAARSSSGACTPVKSVAGTKSVANSAAAGSSAANSSAASSSGAKSNLCRAPAMTGIYFGK